MGGSKVEGVGKEDGARFCWRIFLLEDGGDGRGCECGG